MNKEKFYEKMNPYFEQGLMREVYSGENASILSVGELFYIACPLDILSTKGEPFGVYFTNDGLKKITDNNAYLYSVLYILLDDMKNQQSRFYPFAADKVDFWKSWINERKKTFKSLIDYSFEQELNKSVKSKGGK